jgi:HAD superfamily phosphatase (TIGR01668 family)
MKPVIQSSIIFPCFLANSILGIDAEILLQAGITHIVFDIDKTLVPRGEEMLTQEYIAAIRMLQAAGLIIMIGTNRRRDITKFTEAIGAISIQARGFSAKPYGSFFSRVLNEARVPSSQVAMVGDHIINDIMGANRAGFTTILVDSMHSRHSYFFRIYRYFVIRHITARA